MILVLYLGSTSCRKMVFFWFTSKNLRVSWSSFTGISTQHSESILRKILHNYSIFRGLKTPTQEGTTPKLFGTLIFSGVQVSWSFISPGSLTSFGTKSIDLWFIWDDYFPPVINCKVRTSSGEFQRGSKQLWWSKEFFALVKPLRPALFNAFLTVWGVILIREYELKPSAKLTDLSLSMEVAFCTTPLKSAGVSFLGRPHFDFFMRIRCLFRNLWTVFRCISMRFAISWTWRPWSTIARAKIVFFWEIAFIARYLWE